MKNSYILVLAFLLCISPAEAGAQVSRLVEDVRYGGSIRATAGGGDNAPFWFTANRYGLGATGNNTVMGRAYIKRDSESDSLRFWKVGYGLDLTAGYGIQSNYGIQQAYIDAGWKMLNLSIGQKERTPELKNAELTSGGMCLGMNARPIPQVRIEMPDFWAIPGTRGIFSFKAHLAYGLYTDNKWQREFTEGTENLYTKNSWFHSKALFIRLGNHKLFPLEFTGGIEMACQFGGRGFNVIPYGGGEPLQDVSLGGNIWTALIPGLGGDVNDEAYTNAAGNHIGSWHARIDWKSRNWSLGLYMEHMFEDESQMFMQYGFWKDMLLGMELNLPRNPYVSTILYEHNGTMNQSGPIYHDATAENPQQISAKDNYYDNHVYGSWQHGGFVIGNPTLLSPMYNPYLTGANTLHHYYNRVNAHHIGIKGNPCDQVSWRIMYTHEKTLGSYDRPVMNPLYGDFLMLEAKYSPRKVKGLSITASYGHNGGRLLGNSNAGMLTVSWDGWIRKTSW